MIHTWKITQTNPDEIRLDDSSSLDAITRQLPEGYYSTFRTYDAGTRVIGLSAHLKRLPQADASSLRRHLIRLLEPVRPGEARVRVMQTRQGKFYISIEPLHVFPREFYVDGVRLETTSLHRDDPRVKSTAFIASSREERRRIAQAGIHEALMVRNGRILEGMTSNFFYVLHGERASTSTSSRSAGSMSARWGTLSTARTGILLGVTRTMVIRAARGRGVEVSYRPLKLDQLPEVNEAFITSSTRGIMPVIQIDSTVVGQGRPGELTKMLMTAYGEYVSGHAEKI